MISSPTSPPGVCSSARKARPGRRALGRAAAAWVALLLVSLAAPAAEDCAAWAAAPDGAAADGEDGAKGKKARAGRKKKKKKKKSRKGTSGDPESAPAPPALAEDGEGGAAKDDAPRPDAKEAKRLFLSGKMFFDSGSFDEAVEDFRRAYALAPDKHELLFNIALAEEMAGKPREAYEDYGLFLERLPAAPNRDEVKAKMEALTSRLNVSIRIVSEPPDATLFIDSRDPATAVRTPYAVTIRCGSHTFRVEKAGFRSTEKTLEIGLDAAKKPIRFVLDPLRTGLTVRSRVSGAKVRIDGKEAGLTPLTSPIDLLLGEHLVEVESPRGKVWRSRVVAEEGKPIALTATFGEATRWIGVAFFGLSAGSAATAAYFGSIALVRYRDLEACASGAAACTEDWKREAIRLGKRDALITDICIGAAAATAVTGLFLFFYDRWFGSKGSKSASAASFSLRPDLAGSAALLRAEGTF